MHQHPVLKGISAAFALQDKELVKARVCDALYLKINKEDILQAIREVQPTVCEEFEQWAYMFIVTSGASDCTPG